MADNLNDLAKDSYEKLRLHRRRLVSGLLRMVEDGELDVFDALAAPPLILDEGGTPVGAAYRTQRTAWLDAVAASEGDARQQGKEGGFPARGCT